MRLDRFDCWEGVLVRPDRVGSSVSGSGEAEVAAVAFVGAKRRVIRALQQRHVDILAEDVVHAGIRCLAQHKGVARVGDNVAACLDDDAIRVGLDGDRMIEAGDLH